MQPRRLAEYQKLDKKLQTSFPNFCYKQKVIEEMMNVASNIHERFCSASARSMNSSAIRTALRQSDG